MTKIIRVWADVDNFLAGIVAKKVFKCQIQTIIPEDDYWSGTLHELPRRPFIIGRSCSYLNGRKWTSFDPIPKELYLG